MLSGIKGLEKANRYTEEYYGERQGMYFLQRTKSHVTFRFALALRQPRELGFGKLSGIVLSLMSLDDNTEPPTSPSPSSGCESVEVTGILAVTAFSATLGFDPEWSVSQVANDLRSRLSDSAQQLLELDSPVGLRGLDIFKCRFCTIYSSRLSCSLLSDSPYIHSC
jgi:hypothetical protein